MKPPPNLMPALVTPFDADGEIDLDAHQHNLGLLNGQGIQGFLIGGSTGEGPYLEAGERAELTSAAREEMAQAFLLTGVAAETVRQARAMIAEAVAGGADAVLVITPTTLTRGRMEYVRSYYLDLAEGSPLPLFLYSVPAVTAFELPEEVVVDLSAHENIVGIKDSGGHPTRMQRLVGAVEPGFRLFTGSTQAVTLAIAAGAYGAITASANYLAPALIKTVKVALADPIGARSHQQLVGRLSAEVEAHGIPGVKLASELGGLKPGWPRPPLRPLPDSVRANFDSLFSDHEVVRSDRL